MAGVQQELSEDLARTWSVAQPGATCTLARVRFAAPVAPPPGMWQWRKPQYEQALRERGFTGDMLKGSMAVLKERVSTAFPHVIFEIDTRESLQRLVATGLRAFGYDNTHLFSASMPARGEVKDGVSTFETEDSLMDIGFSAQRYLEEGRSPEQIWEQLTARRQRSPRVLDLLRRFIFEAKCDMSAPTGSRSVSGAAFEQAPRDKSQKAAASMWLGFDDQEGVGGVGWSLAQLALAAGDLIQIDYDFGSTTHFSATIESLTADQPLLAEQAIFKEPTRARILTTVGKLPSQYSRAHYASLEFTGYDDDDDDDIYGDKAAAGQAESAHSDKRVKAEPDDDETDEDI
eukprot:m.247381 g.247381  ORF g.247381 m.247381 type:complete len:345 (+) comp15365_c0_seq1:17-1051(+)